MRSRTKVLLALPILALLVLGGGFAYYLLDPGDAPAPPSVPSAGRPTAIPDGRWSVVRGLGTFAGYRVREEYAAVGVRTAVGRTHGVRGGVQIAGGRIVAADLTADMTQLISDKPQRDDALRGRAIETDRYPRARFMLTRPVALARAGVPATGELQLHGRRAPFSVRVASAGINGRLVLAGAGALEFKNYNIEPPSVAGLVTVRDHGTLEFRLVLQHDR
jgi:polyisoprenoid-binding protein YceI